MNRRAQYSRLTLPILLIALLCPPGFAHAQDPTPTPTPAATSQSTCNGDASSEAGEKIKLYYTRQATNISTMLTAVASPTPSALNGLIIKDANEDEIILYGPCKKRRQASRIIATLDLPRPGIMMELWGVQITSKNPDKMGQAMALIRQEINRTQQAVRETYARLEFLTRKEIPQTALNAQFVKVLEGNLGYRSALSDDHPFSLADILLRMVAAQDPGGAIVRIANGVEHFLQTRHPTYLAELNKRSGNVKNQKIAVENRSAFERFFKERGLVRNGQWWEEDKDGVDLKKKARIGQIAVLDFALEYGRLIHQPQSFDPYYLQHSSEALNKRLQVATDALNLDMQDLFVEPTLDRIREITRKFKEVEYAQVGKTSVASLSGVPAVVASRSVGAFDVTPPLTLTEVMTKAKTLSDSVNGFIPNPTENVVGAMPLSQVIGLVGAFGEDRTVWRELAAGISLNITPNVLRNMTSAELKVDLKTGDPQVTAPSAEDKVKPLSRVTQHDVNTSIYVDPLDFFDLSAFASQSTLDGGRGYVPIIGPVWRGLFGEIPIAGKIFSWKRGTQNVFSQSLVLTTSFITPTSMGIAVLYPTELLDENGTKIPYTDQVYKDQLTAVMKFKKGV